MLKYPSDVDLDRLMSACQPNSVSMYFPLAAPQDSLDHNRIIFKNGIQEVKSLLNLAGVEPKLITKITKPIKKLLIDWEINTLKNASIAVYLDSDTFEYFVLPGSVGASSVFLEKGFHLDPLQKLLKSDIEYYLLSLNHNNVELFRAGHYSLEQVKLKDLPVNMNDALGIDEYPKSFETHNIAPATRQNGSEAMHGHYNVKETDKKMLEQFFRKIDKRLTSYIMKTGKPLVLGGVNYLQPIYRKVNSYPNLLKEGVQGNLEHEKPHDMLTKAWPIVRKAQAN